MGRCSRNGVKQKRVLSQTFWNMGRRATMWWTPLFELAGGYQTVTIDFKGTTIPGP